MTSIVFILILFSGISNILTSTLKFYPGRLSFLREILPLSVAHASRSLIFLSGVFLVYLAFGLRRKKYRSWILSLILVSFSLILHLIKGFDLEEVVILFLSFIVLVKYKTQFSVSSGRVETIKGIKLSLTILLFLFVYSVFGYFLLQGHFVNSVNLKNIFDDYVFSIFGVGKDTLIPLSKQASYFQDSIFTVGVISIITAFGALFSPLVGRKIPSDGERALAKEMVLKYSENSVSPLWLMEDKSYYFSKDLKTLFAYKIAGEVCVVLGDPIFKGKVDKLERIKNFLDYMNKNGIRVVFYNACEKYTTIYKKLGMNFITIGDEAIISLDDFDINKSSLKDVRYGFNKMQRDGITFEWFRFSDIPWTYLNKVDKFHKKWIAEKGRISLGFSVDFYPLPNLKEGFVQIALDKNEELQGIFSYFPYGDRNMTVELMMRSKSSPNGLIEGAIADAIYFFRSNQVKFLNLGLAPLSKNSLHQNKVFEERLASILDKVSFFYKHRGLSDFKRNFAPNWQPKFLVYQSIADLPVVTLSLARVHIKSTSILKNL